LLAISLVLDADLQNPRRILEIDLLEDRIRQADTVNSPTSLRRHRRGCVIEVFVLCLEKAVVDLIQLLAEDLLRSVRSIRHSICAKQNAILTNISKKDIDALAKRYIDPVKMNILLVGDKATILPGLKRLNYEIVELDANGKSTQKKGF